MFNLIDRQLIRGYFKAYFVCLSSLLSLYIVVDLFTNLDDFTHHKGGFLNTLRNIGLYYGFKVTQIFDRLCEAIVLMAAMFTVAWMQRNNEQLPLLSAGVSTRRVVRPVILSACVMLTLTVLNQELIIPGIGERLMYQRDDPDGEKDVMVRGAYEPNNIHIEGETANRQTQVVRNFRCLIPPNLAGKQLHLTAGEARYIPPGEAARSGGWELNGVEPPEIDTWDPTVLEVIDHGKMFLYVQRVDLDRLTRSENGYLLASTFDLYQQLQGPQSAQEAASTPDRKKAVLFHMRLTRPILGVILVILGLSVILKDQNLNVFISTGMCLMLCAFFFVVTFSFKLLGDKNYISPALAAWMPVLIFGPFSLTKFDAVHT